LRKALIVFDEPDEALGVNEVVHATGTP
jgi:hypothetical protein